MRARISYLECSFSHPRDELVVLVLRTDKQGSVFLNECAVGAGE